VRCPAIRLERLTEAAVRVSVGIDGALHGVGRSAQESVLEHSSFEHTCVRPQELVGSRRVHRGLPAFVLVPAG
jgi:hypothetical protein